jgi:aspartate ammonia-lyase
MGYTVCVSCLAESLESPKRYPSQNLVEATQYAGAYVQLSGVLKLVAVKLSKICNDLRLLASDLRAGLHETILPTRAPGSTIMPV